MRHDDQRWTRLQTDVGRLGVSDACKLHGVHRSTWYRRTNGGNPAANGKLRNPDLVEAILRISLERPSWGCDRIAYYLSLSGFATSSPTVQKILIAHGIGKRGDREARAAAIDGESTAPVVGE